MALNKVKANVQRIFDKNLTDLIRGIRNNKENEARYVSQCMEEIKLELRQDNITVKTNAVSKLTYLQMLGYDISWAAFNIIEVMASTRFTDKRIGYLAASQSFHDDTDVLMLTTNMIRKDLNSTHMYEAGGALGGLSCFITTDLARDLANDVVSLLSSSRPYVRKRAVLLLYKVFLKYPDALRPTFPRLKEKLEDPDPGVQSAAVNVICELARKNPRNYLSLAPVFFKLMTTSSNNWMLIKIIKLFGALVGLEPRLGKKLLEPLTNLINSTSAMSLLYECINTVIAVLISVSSGAPGDHTASIQLCVQKLGVLIEDTDQNLKYLGLLAMGKILQTHPKAVQSHKDVVLSCLDDKDESIRLRALDLLYGMVSKKNIMEIVKKLMEHVEAAEGSAYRDELLSRIISICAHNNYQYITNFEWYVSVLVELTKVEGTRHGWMIAQQMLDVAVRVHSIRHFAVSQMALLIENAQLLLAGSAQQRSNISEVLLAAAWICGEYNQHLANPQSSLESMLRTKVGLMPGHIQSTFVQNIGKLYGVLVAEAEKEEDWDRVWSLDNLLLSKLPQFEQTDHLEAQERACSLIELMKEVDGLHKRQERVAEFVSVLFEGELNPVAPKAQRKVPPPQGLDLDEWINEAPESSSESEADEVESRPSPKRANPFAGSNLEAPEAEQKTQEPTKAELKKIREARQAEYETNPHYLKSTKSRENMKLMAANSLESNGKTASLPEIVPADLQSPLEIPGMVGLDKYLQQQQQTLSWKKAKKEKRKKKKGKRAPSSSEEETPVVHEVNRELGEMPEGAQSTDSETESPLRTQKADPFRALDVNLDEPLRDDERLPVPQHRVISPDIPDTEESPKHKKKKKKLDKGEKLDAKTKGKKKKKVVETKEEIEEPKTETKLNDIEQWLMGAQAGDTPPVPSPVEEKPEKHSKKKSKKGEKTSSKKKGKKHSQETTENGGTLLGVRDRSDYEVASGLCTPSKRDDSSAASTPHRPAASPAPQAPPELTSYRLLAENSHLKMTYETRVSTADAGQVAVNLVLTNGGVGPLRQLELNVLDSLNTKLLRDPVPAHLQGPDYALGHGAGITLPFVLPSGLAQEHQIRFSVKAINIPQKLRGTLTYFLDREDGAVPEKLDFHLRFPCIAFTVPATISRDSLAELLSGKELASKSSVSFPCSESLDLVLKKICFHAHFTVVEQVGSTASLYSQTIQADPICLLIKLQDGVVNVDGKATDNQLVASVLSELRDLFQETQ